MSGYLFSTSFLKDPHRLCSKKSNTPFGPYQMSYFEASLVATVLEDTITQFRINMNTSNELRVTQTLAEIDKLIALKYSIERPPVTDELAEIDEGKLDCNEYKLKKMFTDRYFFRDVLDNTYAALCTHSSFAPLADYIQDMEDCKAHRAFIAEDEASNRQLRKDLGRQIRQFRNHVKSAMYDANCTIAKLKNHVEDAALNAEIRGRYVVNWQVARSEQHEQQIKDKETKATQSIEYYKERYDQEQRIHSEVEMLVTIHLNDTLQKIESWMTKYDHDIEAADLKIQIMKNNHIQQKKKREHLEATIEEHDRLMKNWLQFKKDREEARLYHEKMTNAAITVQAWWRGFLVRNQLGPYKPQKRRPVPVEKDKKKKK